MEIPDNYPYPSPQGGIGSFFLQGTLGACITAASNLINGHYQRKLSRELEADKRSHELKVIEIKRQIEAAMFDKKVQHDFNLEQQKYNNSVSIQYIAAYIKRKLEAGGIAIPPGKWKESIIADEPSPYVIFSTQLRQDHNKQDNYMGYNPIMGMYRSFSNQIGNFATVIETHEAFKSEDEVRYFINCEFPQSSVVVVYGDYLGNELNVRATFNGMSREQFIVYSNGEVEIKPVKPRTSFLGQMPSPSQIRETKNNEARATEEFMYSLITNIWLQILIDTHYMFFPEKFYTPRASEILYKNLEYFERLNLREEGQKLYEIATTSDKEVKQERHSRTIERLNK